jgi:hypothetical protein
MSGANASFAGNKAPAYGKAKFSRDRSGPLVGKKIAVKRILQTAAAVLAFPALTKASAFT